MNQFCWQQSLRFLTCSLHLWKSILAKDSQSTVSQYPVQKPLHPSGITCVSQHCWRVGPLLHCWAFEAHWKQFLGASNLELRSLPHIIMQFEGTPIRLQQSDQESDPGIPPPHLQQASSKVCPNSSRWFLTPSSTPFSVTFPFSQYHITSFIHHLQAPFFGVLNASWLHFPGKSIHAGTFCLETISLDWTVTW